MKWILMYQLGDVIQTVCGDTEGYLENVKRLLDGRGIDYIVE